MDKSKNKLLKLGFASAMFVSSLAVATMLNAGGSFGSFRLSAGDATLWNHYSEVEPTYTTHGSKEFWANCSEPGNFVLEAPGSGIITDKGAFTGAYFDALTDADDRYIAPLEGNKFATLDIIDWQDDALLYSTVQYTAVQRVTLKVRVTGGEYSSWMGIGVRADHNDWIFTQFNTALDGEWHLVTVEFGGQDGYVNFCYNLDHVQAGSIDVDDITIVTSDAVYCETFDGAPLFTLDASHARLGGEASGNKFLREDAINIDNEQVLVHSAVQYTAVTNVSFKVRIPSGCGAWGGIAVANDLSIYNNTNPTWTADGEWHSYSRDFASVTGYVEFCHEQGHFTGPLDIDDVMITYDGGKVAIETFEGPSIMKVRVSAKAAVKVEGDGGAAIGVVALNAATTTVESREYSPTFEVSRGVDATYGAYVQLDNWACAANQNRCWIGLTQTEPLALVRHNAGGTIESYYFYMYNPLAESFTMQLMFEHHYSNVSAVTLAPQAWTKVSINTGTWGSYTLTEAHQIGFDRTFGENGAVVGSGWKITSIYAKEPSNYFARIYSSTYSSGTASLYTTVEYTDITSVSFRYRLIGGPQAGKGAWWGFGIAANHDIYTGMHSTSSLAWDGEWHTRTVNLDPAESGYVNLIHACGEQLEGSTIDFDDIVITYDGGQTVTENFIGGASVFMVYPSHPERVAFIEQ